VRAFELNFRYLVKPVVFLVALAFLFFWSRPALESSPRGVDWGAQIVRLFSMFLPPDFSDWRAILKGLQETVQIAFLSTAFAFVVALPLSLLASQKTASLWVSRIFIFVLAGVRTLPSLVWAIIAVALVGPFPLAGVIALTFYSISYLAKFFKDAFESFDYQAYHWLRLHKAPRISSFWFGLWPEIRGLLFRQSIWMFEYNIRSASIIGFVGAGGLGMKLLEYQEYGQWQKFSAVLILILGIVLMLERISKVVD
jgi:phosphonate transport system permease protein